MQKNNRPYDDVLVKIADYVCNPPEFSQEAYQTAQACLADALGCAILALKFKECTKLLGPVVPGTVVPNGSRIIGTEYVLDPIRAAFNFGTMVRWLDYNDTWLAAEWGHPSDNLGSILPVADYVSRFNIARAIEPYTVHHLLHTMIMAYEIQGILALHNSFNRIGFDHVILVKIASTAVSALLMGANHDQILAALSNAWIDAGPLRTYRHAPNTGSRKSWAAGDATSRAVFFALNAMQGEMGYPTALSAPKWGVNDVLFKGQPIVLSQPLGDYVMENVLFKVAFPAEFHAQTAVEAAVHLHPQILDRLDAIESVEIATHESAIRIIDKTGPLHNPADRDHCLQYMVAIALIHGNLTAHHYEQDIAQDPRVDILRDKMKVMENKQYSIDYLDPNKRSIANAVTIRMKDGTILGPIAIEYPYGHRRRRPEGFRMLFEKFQRNLYTHYLPEQVDKLRVMFEDQADLMKLSVPCLVDQFSTEYTLKKKI